MTNGFKSILLVHGGWGGAELHWAAVQPELARRYRVVAPELPGISGDAARGPRSFRDFARCLELHLDAERIDRAVFVGNSFGAAVAARLASETPSRCAGLVLVNGGPAPAIPALARKVLAMTPFRQLMTEFFRRQVWSPSTVDRAFADRKRAPQELLTLLSSPHPPQMDVVRDAILESDAQPPLPKVPTLLIWGAEDRLPGSSKADAERLGRALPNAELAFLANAGHLPQIEQPRAFIDVLSKFLDGVPQ